ncbi:MAG TPA: hypothetical protein VIB39_21690 [Candidatus Angelobacter sp.]|jgi:hypothetical protein
MANTTFGSNTGAPVKKETVYNGPTPPAKQGTVYNGPAPGAASGTVYEGPAIKQPGGGTVYGGPTAGAANFAGAGTVYRPPQPVANEPTKHPGAAKGAGIFFAIAIFTAINTVLIASGSPLVLGRGLSTSKVIAPEQMTGIVVLNILVIGLFVLIGIFARNGSKPAFVIGMLLYGADTALLLFSGDPAAHVGGIVIHVFLLIGLFKGFSQLG